MKQLGATRLPFSRAVWRHGLKINLPELNILPVSSFL